jgi:hypothetical protein
MQAGAAHGSIHIRMVKKSTFHIPEPLGELEGLSTARRYVGWLSRLACNSHWRSFGRKARFGTTGTAKPPPVSLSHRLTKIFRCRLVDHVKAVPLSPWRRAREPKRRKHQSLTSAPFAGCQLLSPAPKPCLLLGRCRHGDPADKLCGFRVVGRLARTGVVRHQPLHWLLRLPLAVGTCGDRLTLVSLLLPLWVRSAGGGGVGRSLVRAKGSHSAILDHLTSASFPSLTFRNLNLSPSLRIPSFVLGLLCVLLLPTFLTVAPSQGLAARYP